MMCSKCDRVARTKGMCQKHYKDAWKKANPDKVAAETRRYQSKHREKMYQASRKWKSENRARVKDYQRAWIDENRSHVVAYVVRRKADQLRATPAWANLEAIQKIYDTCPPGYHVDHIEPLRGKNVCGLHVEDNLRHLPAIENMRKGNRRG